ncbi:cysteine desulfurase [bacterium]|nr:cysteine desulfurase [bacterium]
MSSKLLYLDHNATTPVTPDVRAAMRPYLDEEGFNPSSPYRAAQKVRAGIDRARADVAKLLSCEPEEVVFTSGATESCNLAIWGAVIGSDRPAHLITSPTEHSAVLGPHRSAAERGHRVTYLEIDRSGRIDPSQLDALRTPDTRLVSVMLVNNETGVIQEAGVIGRWCRANGILFHCDATAAVGKMPVHPNALFCDLLSLSGHKFHAPKGIGALFIRRDSASRVASYASGGEQEWGRRPGTENVPGIAGLGAASRQALEFLDSGGPARVEKLRNEMERRLREKCPEVEILGAAAPRVCNTSFLRAPGVHNDEMVVCLDQEGICVSTGAACAAGASMPSRVAQAMGYSESESREVIRVSLGSGNTDADVTRFVEAFARSASRLGMAA